MTAAAWRVSPGGLGEGARTRDWRKAMWAGSLAVRASSRAWAFILTSCQSSGGRKFRNLGSRCRRVNNRKSRISHFRDLVFAK